MKENSETRDAEKLLEKKFRRTESKQHRLKTNAHKALQARNRRKRKMKKE